MARKKRVLILHPFLFAVFPILFLYSRNLGGFYMAEVYSLVARVLLYSLGALVVLMLALKNARKSALVLSLFILLFASYGHFADALRKAGFDLYLGGWGPTAVVAPLSLAAFGAGVYLSHRTRSSLLNLTRILNVSAAFLVLFCSFRIGAYEIKVWRARELAALKAGKILHLNRPWQRRNIYYIVLDAYGRSDVLKELYGYDNSELIEFLRSKGFYVAERSRTNYGYTIPALATCLNYDYPGSDGIYSEREWIGVQDMQIRFDVSSLLREVGYRFVGIGGDPGEMADADMILRPFDEGGFTAELIRTTAAVSWTNPADKKRKEVLHAFDALAETASMDGPLFVYAHIMSPHRPFVFDADGKDPECWGRPRCPPRNIVSQAEGLTRSEYIRHYADQISYIDKLTMKTIDAILEGSATAPIIVLQSDHGPAAYRHIERLDATHLKERLSILNAYRLPDGGDELLYDSITPVNTFRVIFKHYFGAKIGLREDRSFFMPRYDYCPWLLTDVTHMIDDEDDRKRLQMLKQLDYFPEPPVAPDATDPAGDP